MPLVIVAVRPANASAELFKEIDRRIREEIYDAAVVLNERSKIPNPHDKFVVVVSPELQREDVQAEVTLVMLAREDRVRSVYKEAVAVAMHKAGGFLDHETDIRFYGARPGNWRGHI